jgi:hypothetical protein
MDFVVYQRREKLSRTKTVIEIPRNVCVKTENLLEGFKNDETFENV